MVLLRLDLDLLAGGRLVNPGVADSDKERRYKFAKSFVFRHENRREKKINKMGSAFCGGPHILLS